MAVEAAQTVRCFVPGTPRPQGSKDALGRESSKYVGGWRDTIAYMVRAAAGGRTLEPPYRVRYEFVFPRPQKPSYGWPSKADLDKTLRAANDALQIGRVIVSDVHIIDSAETKRYAAPGEEAGVHVEVATASV